MATFGSFCQYPVQTETPDSLVNSASGSSSPAQHQAGNVSNLPSSVPTTSSDSILPISSACPLSSNYASDATILSSAPSAYVGSLTARYNAADMLQTASSVRGPVIDGVIHGSHSDSVNIHHHSHHPHHHHHHHQSSFYPTLSTAYMKESDPWRSIPQTPSYYYDPSFAYGYGGLEFSPARRKNVTRDSTTTLKAWLNEHRKNPYPTKGEKIMLAIITKMTLTQVSTWFANARRRLKKENKMTWEPRNKTDLDRYEDSDDEETAKNQNEEKVSDDLEGSGRQLQPQDNRLNSSTTSFDCSEELKSSSYNRNYQQNLVSNSPELAASPKPKIWSLADTATNKPVIMHADGTTVSWFNPDNSNGCGYHQGRSGFPPVDKTTSSSFPFSYGAPEPTSAVRPPSHQSSSASSSAATNMAAVEMQYGGLSASANNSTSALLEDSLYRSTSGGGAVPHLRLF